ncbi:MAG: hypothetical protein DRN21_04125 [Thermoplasmata archaeon]|nr:MAG: hypothetical protein DRN07_03055 [Thermoplasmata archaeon]RLF39075.1 MAG: hypothetical protein DRN21_04125 [Thermoplasmata archaeon]
MAFVDGRPVINKARSFLELIRPITVMLGLMGVFVGGILGGFHLVSLDLFFAMIVVVFMVAGAMALNDYFDMEVDKIAHLHRPIPSGRLSPKEGLRFAYVSFFIASLLSIFINVFSFGIVVFSIGLLVLYEKYFKDIGLAGNIVAAFISSMALIFGGVAVGQAHNALILAVMTFLIMLGREILKDVEDIDGDILTRVTLPMKIGRKNALYAGCLAIIATIALIPFPYWWNILSLWYIVIIIPAGMLFVYSIILVLKDIKNIGTTIEILRSGSAFALVGFIIGVLT